MFAKPYPWLSSVWQRWAENIEADRFANATLLVAEDGLGVETLVDHFAKALMCRDQGSEPCGFCHSCDLMKSSNHPDYHVIAPEQEGKAITVDMIRQCNHFALESSQLSGYRLIVIRQAHRMNEAASNALLKTLESPGEKCLFLLVAEQSSQLLPTIVSRCQQWNVVAPSSETVVSWVEVETSQTVAKYLAPLNGNAPLKTLAFIEEKEAEKYQELTKLFVSTLRQDVLSSMDLAKLISEAPIRRLSWLWMILVDAQKVHFGLQNDFMQPGAKVIAKLVEYDLLHKHTEQLVELISQMRDFTGLNSELMVMQWLNHLSEDLCS